MNQTLRNMILVSFFAGLMVVGAYIRIPLPLVPITFQPFFCAFAGILLGARLGLYSQLLYIALGLIGLPVFSSRNYVGFQYVLSPTFGFLIGFAAAAFIIGAISRRAKTTPVSIGFSLLAGLTAVYLFGITYLFVIQNAYLGNSVSYVGVVKGMGLFILKDLVLYLVVALVAWKTLPILKKAGLLPDPS